MSVRPHVVKVGGSVLERADDLALGLQRLEETALLVHGGGAAVDALQRKLGPPPVKVAGMRRTEDDALPAVMMALSGTVSSRLVAALIGCGIDAVGLSGIDGGLLRCRRLELPGVDLGWVGEVVSVRSSLIRTLLAHGCTPVIAPLCLGLDGHIYNVNADHAAGALAAALQAVRLDLVSDVPGVLKGSRPLPLLSPSQAEGMLASGEVRGGMIPKVQAALTALRSGVPRVRILDLEGFIHGGGTSLTNQRGAAP